MKFHPYSEIFPLLEGQQLDDLGANIKTNGLREAIWLYEGQVLDGRNRFLACRRVGVQPTFRKYTGDDPLGFVVSLNFARRHLTESQRAMVAGRIADLGRGRPSENTARAVFTQARAAEQMHVSPDSIQRAQGHPARQRRTAEGG